MIDELVPGALFDYDEAIRIATESDGKNLGLPHHFYPDQKNTIIECFRAFKSGQYDNVIVVAPTGSGKSQLAMGLAKIVALMNERTTLVTPTRQLQAQYIESFKDVSDLRSFKGKANYPCLLFESTKGGTLFADTAPCTEFDTTFDPLEHNRTGFSLLADPPRTDHPDLDEAALKRAKLWLAGALDFDEYGNVDKWKAQDQVKMCSAEGTCPYRVARDTADAAKIALLNMKSYFMWNTHAKEAPFFKPRFLTVVDECHAIEDQARDFYTLLATDTGLDDLYHKVLGARKDKEDWVDFSKFSHVDALLQYLHQTNTKALIRSMEFYGLNGQFEEYATFADEAGESSVPAKLIKYYKIFKLACDSRSNFAKAILQPDGRDIKNPTLQLSPVDIPPTFQGVYGCHNVFMSATVADVDVFARSVCIDLKRTRILQLPDTFPVEHRPIVSIPVAKVTKKEIDATGPLIYAKLADTIGEIASYYTTHRILVHTSSYVMGQEMEKWLSPLTRNRLLCPKNGQENKKMVVTYSDRADRTPYILISPACREGYDFEGDLCRIQIFAKCPFPSMGDPVVAKKLEARGGRAWYAAKVAAGLRQQYGRSTRHAKDFSLTFFLDTQITEFVAKNQKLFPKEFHQAMELGRRLNWVEMDIKADGLFIDAAKIAY